MKKAKKTCVVCDLKGETCSVRRGENNESGFICKWTDDGPGVHVGRYQRGQQDKSSRQYFRRLVRRRILADESGS